MKVKNGKNIHCVNIKEKKKQGLLYWCKVDSRKENDQKQKSTFYTDKKGQSSKWYNRKEQQRHSKLESEIWTSLSQQSVLQLDEKTIKGIYKHNYNKETSKHTETKHFQIIRGSKRMSQGR